jgi:hypothetical protein
MTSQLVSTFVERGEPGNNRWLEIWVFRDGTLNLVIASGCTKNPEEHVFPCAPYHVRHVLAGAKFQTTGPAGCVLLRREGEVVVATFISQGDDVGWSQVIPVPEMDRTLLEAARMTGTYVA